MKFRVVWKPAAEQELTRLWLDSRFRFEIAEAASSLDEELQRDPIAAGESRDGSLRIFFVRPLVVLFQIDVAARRVDVVHVWQTRR